MTVPGGAGLDLRGVLLAAIILGAVGVLDDVTVTQAVLVEELAEKGDLRGPALIVSAMRIGRSHIGATVNTLFLAYVSVGLPLIIVLYVSHQPTGAVLNDETIATEIVRTLIGSLGIIAAIPITTFIAGLLAEGRAGDTEGWETFRSRSLSRFLVTVAGIITLLVVTTVISLGGPPRTALTSTALVPSPSAGASGPSMTRHRHPSAVTRRLRPRTTRRSCSTPDRRSRSRSMATRPGPSPSCRPDQGEWAGDRKPRGGDGPLRRDGHVPNGRRPVGGAARGRLTRTTGRHRSERDGPNAERRRTVRPPCER